MTVSGCTTTNAVRQFGPRAREGHPKESVAEREAASRRSVVRRQLLPERTVLQDQFSLAAKHQGECTDDDDKQLQHVRSWLDSARKFNADEFWRGSGYAVFKH